MVEYALNITRELEYARKWAYSRNPAYANFDGMGGDCTNFISQCLYAGGAVMNWEGWYYVSLNKRAPAWTGVEFLYSFLIGNRGAGPFGREVPLHMAEPGDIIQLGAGGRFYHSLLVIALRYGEPYLAAHTNDAYDVPLSSYSFERARCVKISGARR